MSQTFCTSAVNWDFDKLFGLPNPEKDGYITCVGWAPSKHRRCWNPIAAVNQQKAATTLKCLPSLMTDREALQDELDVLAGLYLCKRYHQPQAEDVAGHWYDLVTSKLERQSKYSKAKPAKQTPRRNEERNETADMQSILEQLRQHKEALDMLTKKVAAERETREAELRQQADEEGRLRQARERADELRRKAEKAQRRAEKLQREEERRREARRQAEREKAESEAERRRRAEQEEQKRVRADAARRKEEEQARKRAERTIPSWEESWTRYETAWADCATYSASSGHDIRHKIAWPVRSGRWEDVTEGNVHRFFWHAPPAPDNLSGDAAKYARLLRKHALRWHPDKLKSNFPEAVGLEDVETATKMVMQVINGLKGKAQAKL